MTDREAFDNWHLSKFGTKPNIKMRTEEENNDVFARYQGWQACSQHYDERIKELEDVLLHINNLSSSGSSAGINIKIAKNMASQALTDKG